MSVYKSETNATWFFAVRYTNINGHRKQKKARGFKTKREAIAAERAFLASLNNGISDFSQAKIGEIITIYLADKQKMVKGSTYKALDSVLNGRVRYFFADVPIHTLTNSHILAFHEFLFNPPANTQFRSVKLSTARENHSIFIAMLKYAEKHYHVTMISHKFSPPKAHHSLQTISEIKKLKFYTIEQFQTFIERIDDEDELIRDIIEILYYTGMRIGELLALTYEFIDFNNRKILVRQNAITIPDPNQANKFIQVLSTPKTKNSVRDISLPQKAFDILARYYAHDQRIFGFEKNWFVFSKAKIEMYNYGTLRHHYNHVQAKTKMPRITLHDFRHSHVSLLINSGADALLIKERLGHASVTTTLDTYAHFFPEREDILVNHLDKLLD
ncbi:MAG: site-specific integrase [Culicoidibacterales bacterium]